MKHNYNKKLDIPQDADSARYFIPKGFTAKLEDSVLIIEPEESEDERIRKWLIDQIKAIYDFESPFINKVIAWLEKQKEQTEELSTRLNGLMQEYVKAGKDEEEQEHRLKCYQLFWDALGDSEFFKQKEQKPEWSEDEEQMFRNILNHYSLIEAPTDGNGISKERYLAFIKSLRPQLKYECGKTMINSEPISAENNSVDISLVEWSKEDKIKLDNCCAVIAQQETYFDTSFRQKCLDFLYNLQERFALPKKQEWSEEDKKIAETICKEGDLKPSEKSWLKSLPERFNLQPNKEWSEEDEKTISDACCWIAEYAGYLMDKNWSKASMLMGLTEKLKSLRPSWKPSEEQMNSLRDTIVQTKGYSYSVYLPELYEQLKKL